LATAEEIRQKLKIALDETRMSIMGVQILIGFQLQALIQESFAELPWSSKLCIAAALILMVGTVGLLISPAAQHRLVERGDVSLRIVRLASGCIELALFAFATAIALDVYVAMERIAGSLMAICIAVAAFVAAIGMWFVIGFFHRSDTKQESAMDTSPKRTPLSDKIDQMLTEARVVIPGVQALLGFQLIAVLTKPFEQLPSALKAAHAVGLVLIALSIVLLLAPAAFHRMAVEGEDTPLVHEFGSIAITAATATLALGLGAEIMVAIGALSGRIGLASIVAAVMIVLLFGLWYAWPLAARAHLQRKR
jgi:hypothetical protein